MATSTGTESDDPRPPVWIGHVIMAVPDVAKANEFWTAAGMRHIESGDAFAVLELRGGTHLVLLASEEPVAAGARAPFDLMVEDIDAARARYSELGLAPSELERGKIHDSFTLTDPSGTLVTVNSSHVSDRPV